MGVISVNRSEIVMAIPDLKCGVLPPHNGSRNGGTVSQADLSPFRATTLELCQKFGTTPERRNILRGYLQMRARLSDLQVVDGFQWVDGHFLEDYEKRTRKSPEHIRVVTFCRTSPLIADPNYARLFEPLKTISATRAAFNVDHNLIPLTWPAQDIIEATRFYSAMLSHSDNGVWKGYVRINLNTPQDDTAAQELLAAKDTE